MLYLRCLQAFSDNLQSCHFPVYHSINSYIFLSKFSNFLVITSLENRLSKNLIIRLFLILFSIILSYYASFAILFISSFASINPRCVYTFNVTPISECPIKFASDYYCIILYFPIDLQIYYKICQINIHTNANNFIIKQSLRDNHIFDCLSSSVYLLVLQIIHYYSAFDFANIAISPTPFKTIVGRYA